MAASRLGDSETGSSSERSSGMSEAVGAGRGLDGGLQLSKASGDVWRERGLYRSGGGWRKRCGCRQHCFGERERSNGCVLNRRRRGCLAGHCRYCDRRGDGSSNSSDWRRHDWLNGNRSRNRECGGQWLRWNGCCLCERYRTRWLDGSRERRRCRRCLCRRKRLSECSDGSRLCNGSWT